MSGDKPLHFISWNINGLKSKTEKVLQQIKDADIVFLQETHTESKDQDEFKMFESFRQFFSHYQSNSQGVAILIKRNIDFKLLNQDALDGRFLVVTCKIRDQTYTLVSVYNHKHDKHILHKLTQYLQAMAMGVLVIGGDFNTTLNPYIDKTSLTQNQQHSALRECVEEFITSLHLVDVWRRHNLTEKQYTHIHVVKHGEEQRNEQEESRLDYIFMQEESVYLVQKCEIGKINDKDHNPVCLTLLSGIQASSFNKKQGDLNGKRKEDEPGNLQGLSLLSDYTEDTSLFNKDFILETKQGEKCSLHDFESLVLTSWLQKKWKLWGCRTDLSSGIEQQGTISEGDIVMASQSLLKSENPRPDGIPVSFYKRYIPLLAPHLKALYNKMMDDALDVTFKKDFFNKSIPAQSESSHHFFNVDYLICAAVLVRCLDKHLKQFKNKEGDQQKERREKKGWIYIFKEQQIQKVKKSFLKEVIEKLGPTLNFSTLDKLLRNDEQDQDCKQLYLGCPLTPALLLLCIKHIAEKEIETLQIPMSEIRIYRENMTIILPEESIDTLSDNLVKMFPGSGVLRSPQMARSSSADQTFICDDTESMTVDVNFPKDEAESTCDEEMEDEDARRC